MYRKEDLIGATVTALGMTFEIAKVLGNFEYYADWGFNIEFLDPDGNYHHWKQWDDGGEIKMKKMQEEMNKEVAEWSGYYEPEWCEETGWYE